MSRPRLPQALLGQASAVLGRLPEVGQNPLLRQRVLTEVRQAPFNPPPRG